MLDSVRSAGVSWRRRQEQSGMAGLYRGATPNFN